MASFKRFEEIVAWQKARALVRAVYSASGGAAFHQDWALRDQLRRAAVSVMSNIAEGFGRRSRRDFAHFLDLSRGSAAEVQSLLYVALDQTFIRREAFSSLYALADEVQATVAGLTAYLRRTPGAGTTREEGDVQ